MKKVDLSNAKKLNACIITRGEVSGHSHIVTGNCDLYELEREIYIDAKDDRCVIKHLLEKPFVEEGRRGHFVSPFSFLP